MCVNRPSMLLMRLPVNSRHLVVKFGEESKVIGWFLNGRRVRAPPPVLFKDQLCIHTYTYSYIYDVAGWSRTLTLKSPASKERKGTWYLQTWRRGRVQTTQSATRCLVPGALSPPPESSLFFLLFWLSSPAFSGRLPLPRALFQFCISHCLHRYLTESLSLLSRVEFPKGFPQNTVVSMLCKLCVYKQLLKNRDRAYLLGKCPNKYLLHE